MRVLLLHPPGRYKDQSDAAESLGLGYVAAVLRQDGHEVEILDANARCMKIGETVRQIAEREFDCLGITAMHDSRIHVISVVQGVRKKKKDALVMVGGYLPSLNTEQFLTACPEVDFVVLGEAETSACEVIGRIGRGEDWRSSPGVAYRSNGEVISNPCPALVADLDSLPFPARDSLIAIPTLAHTTIAGSRGCYHRCSFCSIHAFYGLSGAHPPRFRSPGNVVDEIESVMSLTGRNKFQFVDDDFLGAGAKGRERAIGIADEIRSRNLKISFSIECRADAVEEDLLRSLKEAGLTGLFLGIESGVQRQLDVYNKKATVEQNRRAIEIVRKLDLRLASGLIMFDPYTTMNDLLENLKFIQETGCNRNSALESMVLLYRGAPLTERVREDELLIEKGLDLDFRFQDRSIAMLWRSLKTMGVCWDCLKRATGSFRR